ncbi:MAG: polymerase I protein, partial [Candidatus Gottesmanbacteria bacterium GW2011_GWA2_47_9]
NYPGVSGIGPKTAITLVEAFGSIDHLYKALKTKDARVKKVSDAIVEKLKTGEESARMSHDLATIRTDVPIEATIEDARVGTIDTPQARKILEDLHFHSLLKRLTGNAEEKKPTKKEKKEEQELLNSEQQQLL